MPQPASDVVLDATRVLFPTYQSAIATAALPSRRGLFKMFDVRTQERFNKSCTEAVVNYLNASGAAYQAVAGQMLRMWGQSVDNLIEQTQQASGTALTSTRSSSPSLNGNGAASCVMPWAALPSSMFPGNQLATLNPFGVPYGMFAPMTPFLDMMKPFQATAWPMAVGMISFGVPEQVAWPTARGHAAAMDAYNVAANSVEKAFSDYRRDQRAPSRVERFEQDAPTPFTLAFAIMPFDPDMLMRFFKQRTDA